MRILLTNTAAESWRDMLIAHAGMWEVQWSGIACALTDVHALSETRFVLPQASHARAVYERIVRAVFTHTCKPCPAVHTDTFHTCVRHLYRSSAGAARPPLSPAGQYLLIRRSIERCAADNSLRYFANSTRELSKAVTEYLAGMLERCLRAGYTDVSLGLQLTAQGHGIESQSASKLDQLHDITTVLREYLNACASLSMGVDTPHMYQHLADSSAPLQPTGSGPLIFDGFADFSEPELQVLERLGSSSLPVAVFLHNDASNEVLFGPMRKLTERLALRGFSVCACQGKSQVQGEGPGEAIEHHSPAYAAKRLFATSASGTAEHDATEPHAAPADKVQIMSFQDQRDEVESIARYVKYCIRHRGIAAHRIAVVSAKQSVYATLLRREFEDSGIPYSITDTEPLSASPVVAAFFAAMDCCVHEYTRHDVERILCNPWLNLNPTHTTIDTAGLMMVAGELRISGGKDNGGIRSWLSELQAVIDRTAAQLAEGGDDVGTSDRKKLLALHRRCTKALYDIRHVSELLPDPNSSMSPQDFARVITNILNDLGVNHNVSALIDRALNEQHGTQYPSGSGDELALITRSLNSLVSLTGDLCTALTETGCAKATFREYLEHLRALVQSASVRVRGRQQAGVALAGVHALRGTSFSIVIVAGMNEGVFPAASGAASRPGVDPLTDERREHAERMALVHLLTNSVDEDEHGSSEFLFSYPKKNSKHEDMLASTFVDELRTVYGAAILDAESLRREQSRDREGDEPHDHASSNHNSLPRFPWLQGTISIRQFLRESAEGLIDAQTRREQLQSRSEIYAEAASSAQEIRATYAKRMANSEKLTTPAGHDAGVAPNSGQPDVPLNDRLIDPVVPSISDHVTALSTTRYSISELELYASCPYKYFASHNLRLAEPPNEETSVTAAEKGILLHRIAFRFYSELHNELLPADTAAPRGVVLDPRRRDEYLQRLLQLASEVSAELAFNHPLFEAVVDEIIGTNSTPGLLAEWLDREMLRSIETGFMPFLFEQSFGRTSDGVNSKVRIHGREFRGVIDRIDIRPHPNGGYEFLVVDYKSSESGIKSNSEIVKAGTSFQMPVYIVAAQQLLAQRFDTLVFTPVGGLYVPFRKKSDGDQYVLIEKHDKETAIENLNTRKTKQVLESMTTLEAVEVAIDHLQRTMEKLESGLFPVEPASEAICGFCSFGSVCRIDELRRIGNGSDVAENGSDDSSAE